MEIAKCGHNHKAMYYNRKENRLLYDKYLEWKYTIGYKGTNEICWECFKKVHI